MLRAILVLSFVGTCYGNASASEPIQLASDPALSPDGKVLVFAWRGDLWRVPTEGGTATALTTHPASDRSPLFSPDGKTIAFISNREGSDQVYTMPAAGGAPTQLTFHTNGYGLEDWYPDGKSLLVSGRRDHGWNARQAVRFFRIAADKRGPETMVFDTYGADAKLSPDGKKLLFSREGEQWWRKGYHGSQAAQVWLADLDKAAPTFTAVLKTEWSNRAPLWKPDGTGFYYVGQHGTAGNLMEQTFGNGAPRTLTQFADDLVVMPCLSRDGSTIVFRHLFDFYRSSPVKGGTPTKIDIRFDGDSAATSIQRRALTQASQAAFSDDGLEIAFIAGGDLWVMDTELREPRQVTNTPEEERSPQFSPDGQSLLFVSDAGGQSDLHVAKRTDASKYWWQNETFSVAKLTNDAEAESNPQYRPDGKQIAFVKGRGELWTIDADGKNGKRIIGGFAAPDYEWSPDGKWFAAALTDDDFNRDIFIIAADGKGEPYNVSRHPGSDGGPAWSPDGKALAFLARRRTNGGNVETELAYVYLQTEDQQRDRRDRTLDQALEKMKKGRKKESNSGSKKGASEPPKKDAPKAEGEQQRRRGGGQPTPAPTTQTPGAAAQAPSGLNISSGDAPRRPKDPKVVIHFDGLYERVRRIATPDVNPNDLLWSPDSKRLAFTGTLNGARGTLFIEIPDGTRPQLLNAATGSGARWLDSNQIVWVSGGTPSSLSLSGKASNYSFRATQEFDLRKKHMAAFELAWRIMRDNFYDGKLGKRDWNAIREKYRAVAATPDVDALATVANLMLGELNGSHLGFSARGGRLAATTPVPPPSPPGPTPSPTPPPTPAPTPDPAPQPAGSWQPVTAHLGVRFDSAFKGPGLKIRDVIPDGPADRERSKLHVGEVIRKIDGHEVGPQVDLTQFLNGLLDRDIVLLVAGADGKERTVRMRPISYSAASNLLYEKWIRDNRKAVAKASDGKLGYLYIRGMDQSSFNRLEEELFSVGSGKEGLIIDVRDNGGGSTADHLLTVLCQPRHAFTVPRGGGTGYPGDRIIYATWNKPVLVLCNQNSFSNAEIFSHAIKGLKRGKLVGVPTAGGVISTGAAAVMDVGTVRLPFRGWFDPVTGEDMELRGAVPDVTIWPEPADQIAGNDKQLLKGVELLLADVRAAAAQPKPKARFATERPVK